MNFSNATGSKKSLLFTLFKLAAILTFGHFLNAKLKVHTKSLSLGALEIEIYR